MATKPTKRELNAQETREKILDVSERLFTEYGYEKVTVKEVSAAAGVTTGALYYHFDNKEGILKALFDRRAFQFDAVAEKLLKLDDPVEAIVRFLSEVMTQRIEDDGIEFTRQRVLHFFDFSKSGFDSSLKALVHRAVSEGRFRADLGEDELCDCLSAVQRGTVYQYCVSAEPVDLRAVVERRLRCTIEGIAAER